MDSLSKCNRALTALGIATLIVHACMVLHQAVNIPVADEWEYFLPGALAQEVTWQWLVAPHNEHRIVFTKLLAWGLFQATHLNFIANVAINLLLYGVLCALLIRVVRGSSNAPMGVAWIVLASGVLHEVHAWGFLSQFHFFALFFVAGLCALPRRDWLSWFVVPCAIATTFAFASGVFCGAALGGAALLFAWLKPPQRRQRLLQSAFIFSGVGVWAATFHKNPSHPAYEPPWQLPFWRHLCTTVAGGMGIDDRGTRGFILGLVLLALAAALLAREAVRILNRGSEGEHAAVRLTYALGLLGGVCATSLARAGFDAAAPSPRYFYPIVLLIPLCWLLAHEHVLSRFRMLPAAAALLMLAPFINDMDFNRHYRPRHRRLEAALQCIHAYLRHEGDPWCPDAYPSDLGSRVQRARELDVSFAAQKMSAPAQKAVAIMYR